MGSQVFATTVGLKTCSFPNPFPIRVVTGEKAEIGEIVKDYHSAANSRTEKAKGAGDAFLILLRPGFVVARNAVKMAHTSPARL